MVQPTDFTIRSFHYRALSAAGARFTELAGAAMAADYGADVDKEKAQAQKLGLADLSTLPRTGFKGREAIAWLGKQGLQIEDSNNRTYPQEDGSLIARLADSEAIVLGPLNGTGDRCAKLNDACETEQQAAEAMRCFHVPRQDGSAWYLLTGTHISEMFAKICAIDLRLHKFPNGSIAQTNMARMNGIVIRQDIGDTSAFHVVFDSASADYLWACLLDAMAEFDGAPVGHAAILAL